MVKDGFAFMENGFRILRNFECSFGEYISNEEILELDKESNLKNAVLMIDEIQIFFDSRRGMYKHNINFSNFVQQIRKRNILILCTTQYSNTIDLRLRQHLDILAYPKYFKKYDVCSVTYIDLTTFEDDLFNTHIEPKRVSLVFDCKPIYKMYKTDEMII